MGNISNQKCEERNSQGCQEKEIEKVYREDMFWWVDVEKKSGGAKCFGPKTRWKRGLNEKSA